MGSIRRGLIGGVTLLVPNSAAADACQQQRPGWTGGQVSAWEEVIFLAQTPIVLALLIATALVIRLRSQWGGLIVVIGWSIFTYMLIATQIFADIRAEGCAGSPALFIGLATAICIGIVLYTTPQTGRQK
ncbi:hypothetical protein [Yoonia sp. 2307UL14-13]|uniref:hypothetical protein n=1 Tax=Yoonia sp. 2307UL14-13 TaxID=3126506 RepID=UPI0030B6F89F